MYLLRLPNLLLTSMSLSLCFFLASCAQDDPAPSAQPTGQFIQYPLNIVGNSGVSGTALFEELDDETTLITVELTGTNDGDMHPSHIHFNTAVETGGIAISLAAINGTTGISETIVSKLDDNTAISYSELIQFDGYINVHNSSSDLGTLLSQGDIGQNVLTGTFEEYDLSEIASSGLSGTATFYKRLNNETLVDIILTGDDISSDRPAHIHNNTAAEGGSIAISLSNVQNGRSMTNITQTNAEVAITYDELIEFDGYINVHNSTSDLGTLVSQVDIGQNALTGTSVMYTINEANASGISGTATFYERKNNETLIILELTGTTVDGSHPAHIHNNDVATGGGIAINLINVNGTTGISKSNITQLNNATPITYSGLTGFNGYINVHNSPEDLSTVANGDIGSNG